MEVTMNELHAMDISCDGDGDGDNDALNQNANFSILDLTAKEHSTHSPVNYCELSVTLSETERKVLKRSPLPKPPTVNAQPQSATKTTTTEIPHHSEPTELSMTEEASEVLGVDDSEFFQQPLVELGRRLWPSTTEAQNYIKGCQWSPDGTCLLLPVHKDGMHVIELPLELYCTNATTLTKSSELKLHALPSAVHVREGGTVYDYVWYPFMNSGMPETCCWLATRQHEPIHMWDAFTGELRCSYRGYDDVDEVEAAISLTFSNDAKRVIAGYKKAIKVFDTNVPGRDCSNIKVKQAISCFALTTDNNSTVTTGSWNGYINHYDLRAAHLGALFTLGGNDGGITWLRYVPHAGNNWMLYSGARKDNKIVQYDMRNYQQPVRTYTRTVDTNQRIYFDFSPQQRWLASGDTRGILQVWDLHDDAEALQLSLHQDCLNGVNFHPMLPILATTSGQYHFSMPDAPEPNDEIVQAPLEKTIDYENALLLLWLGGHSMG